MDGTIGPYTPLFRDNFAGRTLQSADYSLGWLTQAIWDGPVRGLFSNRVPSGRELLDAKMGVVLAAMPLSRFSGGISATERLIIGRDADLAKPGAVRAGARALQWPSKLPDFKAEWAENSGRLREAMRIGQPIRDMSPGDTGGLFLNAERNLFRDRGWMFDPQTNYWMPFGQ